jgi:hypothetical protein
LLLLRSKIRTPYAGSLGASSSAVFDRATEIAAYRGNIMLGAIIRTTIGELIIAVSDKVMPFVRDPSRLYLVVSYGLASG